MALLSDIDTGRTQFMIDQLCDAVAEGQPRSLVIGHSRPFCEGVLIPRIAYDLIRRGFNVSSYAIAGLKVWHAGDRKEDAALILVIPASRQYRMNWEGRSGYGVFFDHHAESMFPEECDEIAANTLAHA